jgi:hypothetical protein
VKEQKFLDVIALAVNIIVIWILDSEGTKVLDVIALAVNVIIILY